MMTSSNENIFWPFVQRIHRSPVNSPHKGQSCGALMFSLICTWINSWVNNPEVGDLRRHRAHCDVSVMNMLYIIYSVSRAVCTRVCCVLHMLCFCALYIHGWYLLSTGQIPQGCFFGTGVFKWLFYHGQVITAITKCELNLRIRSQISAVHSYDHPVPVKYDLSSFYYHGLSVISSMD